MRPHESLHHHDVKDIGFEEPAPEDLFDLQRDISPSDREMMRKRLESDRMNAINAIHLATLYTAIRDLDPVYHPPFQISPESVDIMRLEFLVYLGGHEWFQVASLTPALRHLDPAFSPEDISTPKLVLAMQKGMKLARTEGHWRDFAIYANVLCVIDHTFDPDTTITSSDRENMRRRLQDYRVDGDGRSFARLAEAMHSISRHMKVPSADHSSPRPLPQVKKY